MGSCGAGFFLGNERFVLGDMRLVSACGRDDVSCRGASANLTVHVLVLVLSSLATWAIQPKSYATFHVKLTTRGHQFGLLSKLVYLSHLPYREPSRAEQSEPERSERAQQALTRFSVVSTPSDPKLLAGSKLERSVPSCPRVPISVLTHQAGI